MHLHSIFSNTIELAQKSLDVSLLRQEVIANNIANVDTPYYKRKMVTFESELNRVLDEQRRFPKYLLKTSQTRHIKNTFNKSIDDVQAHVFQEHDTHFRNDKNNVDIEKEVGDLNKNALHYNAVSTSIRLSLEHLKTAVTA